ncbi:hypothetical protein LTR94_030716, partial [Friedmanniomyces endolithicus]
LRVGRIMGHAHGVGAHLAQQFELAFGRAHVEGGAERAEVWLEKADQLDRANRVSRETQFTPKEAGALGITVNADGQRRSIRDLLAFPNVTLDQFVAIRPEITDWSPAVRDQVEIDAVYASYLDRQTQDAEALRREEGLSLPADLDYAAIGALSNEAPAADRLGGSVALAFRAAQLGAQMVRVHDVKESVQALHLWRGLADAGLSAV